MPKKSTSRNTAKAAGHAGDNEAGITLGQLEETLATLETLVEQLESGELPLDQAVKEFERGIELTRQCQAVLKDAERKVEILLERSTEPEPFEAEPED